MEESILKLVTLQFLDGPTFLLIYTVGLGICIFASTQVRAILVKAIHAPALSSALPSSCELAYLHAGRQRAVLTAVVRLEAAGMLKIDTSVNPPTMQSTTEASASNALESVILRQASRPIPLSKLSFMPEVQASLDSLKGRLVDQGYLLPGELILKLQGMITLLYGTLITIGLLRLLMALFRRPVGWLAMELLISIVLMLVTMMSMRERTPKGDRFVQEQERECAALKATALSNGQLLGVEDKALAMALFGTAAAIAMLRPPLPTYKATSSSCGDSFSSSCGASCGAGSSSCASSTSSCGGGGGGCGSSSTSSGSSGGGCGG